jgi:plastocyanin
LVPECETWRSQLRKGFVLDCPGFAPPIKGKENVVTPGVGVMRVTPIAFSRQTGYFYAQGTSSMIRPRRLSDDPWFWGQGITGPVPPLPSVNVLAAIDARTNRIAWKVDAPPGAGPLTTAGGLMFRVAPDGTFEAYDAKNGAKLWEFQTGRPNARGPASSYEIDGEQYIAVSAGPLLWAFKLGGQVPAQAGFKATGALPPPQQALMIETSTLVTGSENNGRRYAMDEHAFNPGRAGVKGFVRFLNNGTMTHTIVAEDGAWTVGPLKPAQQGGVAFSKPGTYTYHCKEHPWAIGQLIVEP